METLIVVAVLAGVAPGDDVCVLETAREYWTVAAGVAKLVEVG